MSRDVEQSVIPPAGLVTHRVLPASPSEVFEPWTDPTLLARWMSPYGAAEATLDLREGGTFRITMLSEGTSIEHSGRYLVIQPPERLVFTWESPYTGPEPSRVSVTLRPHPEGTLLTLAHERLPVEEVASHEGG